MNRLQTDFIWSSIETLLETILCDETNCGLGLTEFYKLSCINENGEYLINMRCCLQNIIQKMNSRNPEHALWAVSAIYNLSFSENGKLVLQNMDECLSSLARASVRENTGELVEIDSCKQYAICALTNLLNTHQIRDHFSTIQNGKWADILDMLTVCPPPIPPSPPSAPDI